MNRRDESFNLDFEWARNEMRRGRPARMRDPDVGGLMVRGIVLFALALNLALWTGLIYAAFWCADHFGLI